MPKKRTRKASRAGLDVAGKGTLSTSAPGRRGRGRPPVHSEPWTKVTVILLDRQVIQLDRLSTDIRERTGAVVNRAGLIRAMVQAGLQASIDLRVAASEPKVTSLLIAKQRP